MLLSLSSALPEFQIRTIRPPDFPAVYQLEQTNTEYFLAIQGAPPSYEECVRSISMLPPNTSPSQKLFLGIYKDSSLIGLLDLVEGYPDTHTLYIGLLMIEGTKHRQGYGTCITHALIHAAQIRGFTSLRLAVIDTNLQGAAFWKKLGFSVLRKVTVQQIPYQPATEMICLLHKSETPNSVPALPFTKHPEMH